MGLSQKQLGLASDYFHLLLRSLLIRSHLLLLFDTKLLPKCVPMNVAGNLALDKPFLFEVFYVISFVPKLLPLLVLEADSQSREFNEFLTLNFFLESARKILEL